jgi:L-2,4-diaminobutyrate transaminase
MIASLLHRPWTVAISRQGDILGFAPPLCLTRAEADQIVAATAAAVADVLTTAEVGGT